MEKQIADLKTEKTSLESKQSAIQAEIDKSINLDQIKDYAEKKLHMIYPKYMYKFQNNLSHLPS